MTRTSLGKQIAERLADATLAKTASVGLEHARLNLPYVERTVQELVPVSDSARPESAIVVGAGPSLRARGSLGRIKASGYSGLVVTTDGALRDCLLQGLAPHYVVVVDPGQGRIVRLFGDPDLEARPPDGDIRRHETFMDLGPDESSPNRQLIALVDRSGPKMKAAIATSVHPSVTQRVMRAGMELYWWNPLYDDPTSPDSYSRRVYELTKMPCLVTGGNSGTSAWVFAHSILRARHVALVGMDLGYEEERPPERTQYAPALRDLLGERMHEAFIRVWNPHVKRAWFTDPTFYWYRQGFLDLAKQAPCETYNCTEGGTLFGPGIKFVPLERFLAEHGSRSGRA